jgi:hypothetical protein
MRGQELSSVGFSIVATIGARLRIALFDSVCRRFQCYRTCAGASSKPPGCTDPAPRAGYLHPKKVGEVINTDDLQGLCKRFDEQHTAASKRLTEWLERLSPYLREFRRLEAEVKAEHANEPKGD